MADLWKPPNIRTLPTPSEVKLAKESIDILEVQLQNALVALQLAQHAVTTLQRQIDERKSWIAPIRRIPHDVIYMIFLELCQMNWSAPLVLSHVCYDWREFIIASPQVWSYFQLQDSQSHELQSLFLSRSAPCHLHLELPRQLGWHTSRLLANATERIKCLRMGMAQTSLLQDNHFPALESLSVVSSDTQHSFILNADLFPRLRSLYVQTFLEGITWKMPPFSRFVPLQSFSAMGTDPHVWSMIVENCCESLTSLSVHLWSVDGSIPDRKVILLPHLKYLSINNYSPTSIPWVIDARTPALQAYAETSWKDSFALPIHQDTKAVISLRFSGDMDLSKFPQVRQMRFDAPYLDNVMIRLMEAPEICSNLETIVDDQLGGTALARAKQLIAARNRQTGGHIRFERGRDDGIFSYYGSLPSNCGYDMPCAFR